MTTYNELVSTLLDRLATTGADEPEGKLAYLGFAPSSYTIKVTGAPNWVWVRLADDDERAPSQALNLAQVRLFPDLPVRVKQQGKRLVVTGYDPTTIDEFLGNRSLNITSPDASEPDLVGPRRIKPGLVHAYSDAGAYSMTVQIESFWYVDPEARAATRNPASLLDLTAYIPASSNNHAYVMVVFDRATQDISVISGAPKLVTLPLGDADISSIDLGDKTPLCAVKLTNGMTALDKDYYFEDVRPWWLLSGDRLPVALDDVSAPPTAAELTAIFGAPADVGAGFGAMVNDNGAETAVHLVRSTGTNWWIVTMTQAT